MLEAIVQNESKIFISVLVIGTVVVMPALVIQVVLSLVTTITNRFSWVLFPGVSNVLAMAPTVFIHVYRVICVGSITPWNDTVEMTTKKDEAICN